MEHGKLISVCDKTRGTARNQVSPALNGNLVCPYAKFKIAYP